MFEGNTEVFVHGRGRGRGPNATQKPEKARCGNNLEPEPDGEKVDS